jgi:hypothetical protein
MFRAFVVAWLFFPLSVHAETVVVDDEDGAPSFTTTSDNWATWSTNGEGFDSSDTSYHYLSHTVGDGSREGTATWTPTLSTAGTWRIETWFRRTDNRSEDADHIVTDGAGATHRVSIDQSGSGGSGWVELGEYTCNAGSGGCTVTLDGDDGASDEADAMRFTLVEAGTTEESEPCTAGSTQTAYAASASGDDWSDEDEALGEADGDAATCPNVDAGEVLSASGFDLCDPDGDELITGVRLAVRARTQYESGTYALELQLDGGGIASVVFTGTDLEWHEVDLTSDAAWTWTSLEAVTAQVSLYDHPGGERDSDAWVDAFRLEVDTVAVTVEEDEPDTGASTGETPEDESGTTGEEEDSASPTTTADTGSGTDPVDSDGEEASPTEGPDGGTPPGSLVPMPAACSQAPSGAVSVGGLLGMLLLLRRRLRRAPSAWP